MRQGDIWGYQFPGGYQGLRDHYWAQGGDTLVTKLEDRRVLGTRHRLNGDIVQQKLTLRLGGKQVFVPKYQTGSGVLSAPDHADVELEGQHILAQTRGIVPLESRFLQDIDGRVIRMLTGD